jgi:hypothetical protein
MKFWMGLFLMLLIALSGCSESKNIGVTPLPSPSDSYRAGKEAAAKDLKQGILAVETYGLPMPSYGEYENLLKKNYHIELRPIAGCVVDDDILNHVKGYNEVSKAEIHRRFGKDVFEKTMTEAQKAYEAKFK